MIQGNYSLGVIVRYFSLRLLTSVAGYFLFCLDSILTSYFFTALKLYFVDSCFYDLFVCCFDLSFEINKILHVLICGWSVQWWAMSTVWLNAVVSGGKRLYMYALSVHMVMFL